MNLFRTAAAWLAAINDKNLDYEIETETMARFRGNRPPTINDKNLDYEIETYWCPCGD